MLTRSLISFLAAIMLLDSGKVKGLPMHQVPAGTSSRSSRSQFVGGRNYGSTDDSSRETGFDSKNIGMEEYNHSLNARQSPFESADNGGSDHIAHGPRKRPPPTYHRQQNAFARYFTGTVNDNDLPIEQSSSEEESSGDDQQYLQQLQHQQQQQQQQIFQPQMQRPTSDKTAFIKRKHSIGGVSSVASDFAHLRRPISTVAATAGTQSVPDCEWAAEEENVGAGGGSGSVFGGGSYFGSTPPNANAGRCKSLKSTDTKQQYTPNTAPGTKTSTWDERFDEKMKSSYGGNHHQERKVKRDSTESDSSCEDERDVWYGTSDEQLEFDDLEDPLRQIGPLDNPQSIQSDSPRSHESSGDEVENSNLDDEIEDEPYRSSAILSANYIPPGGRPATSEEMQRPSDIKYPDFIAGGFVFTDKSLADKFSCAVQIRIFREARRRIPNRKDIVKERRTGVCPEFREIEPDGQRRLMSTNFEASFSVRHLRWCANAKIEGHTHLIGCYEEPKDAVYAYHAVQASFRKEWSARLPPNVAQHIHDRKKVEHDIRKTIQAVRRFRGERLKSHPIEIDFD